MSSANYDFFAGVDWGEEEHYVYVCDASREVIFSEVIGADSIALSGLCAKLLEAAGDSIERVAVAIEVPRGPVVAALLDAGVATYSINPKQLANFRGRFTNAGAKDDRRDAKVLARSLMTDPDAFHRVSHDGPHAVQLRDWSRLHEQIQTQLVALTNQVRAQLQRYHSQAIALKADLSSGWFLEILVRASTPEKARRMRKSAIASILKKGQVRRLTADEIVEIFRTPPLKVAPGTVEAASGHVLLLIAQIRLLKTQRLEIERKIDEQLDGLGCQQEREAEARGEKGAQTDVKILRSLPGVGRIVLASLLAEASELLGQRDYKKLRLITGVAPVTESSGKRKTNPNHERGEKHALVTRRRACNTRLRQATFHWGRVAVQLDPVCKEKYASLRSRGKKRGHALRVVADRLLGVACAMLKNRTLYDPSKVKVREQGEPGAALAPRQGQKKSQKVIVAG